MAPCLLDSGLAILFHYWGAVSSGTPTRAERRPVDLSSTSGLCARLLSLKHFAIAVEYIQTDSSPHPGTLDFLFLALVHILAINTK